MLIRTILAVSSISLGCRTEAAEDATTKSLLDEVIAGYEANMALIQQGTASYRTVWDVREAPPHPSYRPMTRSRNDNAASGRRRATSEAKVYFDYPRLRIDSRNTGRVNGDEGAVTERRDIFDSVRCIEYHLPPGDQPTSPRDRTVLIVPETIDETTAMHPRRQLPSVCLTDLIRAKRNDPHASIVAREEARGLIRINLEWPDFRAVHLVSANDGYCAVRSEWGQPSRLYPEETYEATVQKTGNEAYVVERRIVKRFELVNGIGELDYSEEAVLVGIDLPARLDEKMFTLDGLGLPAGARIQDKVEGREYQYAVAAVKEQDIRPAKPSGPLRERYWVPALYVAAGICLVAVGFITYRIRVRHRGTKSER